MTSSKEFFLLFIKKEKVAKNTYSFYFDRSHVNYDFRPGQYNRMILPHDNPDERGTSRFFTVVSSPLEKDYLVITTKIVRSTFKKKLASLIPGDKVKFFGPMGNLVLLDDEKESLVLLAGGMGITPFRSMLTYAGVKKLNSKITLLASFSAAEEMVFHEELVKIANERPTIKVVYATKSPEELVKEYIKDVQQSKYYVVGPPEMVDVARQMLESLRVPEEKIVTESFIDY